LYTGTITEYLGFSTAAKYERYGDYLLRLRDMLPGENGGDGRSVIVIIRVLDAPINKCGRNHEADLFEPGRFIWPFEEQCVTF
jgi:hypothetical protein